MEMEMGDMMMEWKDDGSRFCNLQGFRNKNKRDKGEIAIR